MKKSTYIIYICIVVAICIIPFAGMSVYKNTTTSENKTPAQFPSVTKEDGSVNLDFMSGLGDYFLDRFAFRGQMVSVNSFLSAKLFKTSTVEDVIIGENDWLYYSATLDDYRHDNGVSERQLYNMAHNTKLMQDYCENLGETFIFTIAPNKNSLYGDNMPDRYKYMIGDKSDAQRLLPYLNSEGVNYLDLFELFESQDEVLYYKKDSHWNNKGAVLVYNKLLEEAKVEHETYEDVIPEIVDDYYGDLNKMLYANLAEPESDYKYKDIFPYAYINPEATVEDMTIETINPSADGSLLMYRDSFGNSLLPYMASAFENAYFSKVVPYPMSDTDLCNPDVVIVEKVERHLPTLAQVPPVMKAPVAEMDGDSDTSDLKAEIQISESGDFTKIEGKVDGTAIDLDSPIYVRVKSSDSDVIYNAFCVSSKSGDYGFIAYVPEGADSIENCDIIGTKDGVYLLYSK